MLHFKRKLSEHLYYLQGCNCLKAFVKTVDGLDLVFLQSGQKFYHLGIVEHKF